MRFLSISLLLAVATACTGDRLAFDYDSQIFVESRGLAIHDNGQLGHAAMLNPQTMNGNTTCEFWTDERGLRPGDYDLPSDHEKVLDAVADTVLALSPGAVHLVRTSEWPAITTVQVDAVIDAQLFQGGMAVLRSTETGCAMEWRTEVASPVSLALPTDACDDSATLSVDRLTGTAFVATGTDVFRATSEGAETLDASGDLVLWDDTAAALFVASTGDSELFALPASGEPWSIDLSNPVLGFESVGSEGRLATMISHPSGSGEIVVIDGLTGEIDQGVLTPEPADIEFSRDGTTMALITAEQIHFYGVRHESGATVHWSMESAGVEPPQVMHE